MSDKQHAPTPWLIDGQEFIDSRGVRIKDTQENADFVIRAVNNHQALLDACKQAFLLPRPWIFTANISYDAWDAAFTKIEAAIQEAETQ